MFDDAADEPHLANLSDAVAHAPLPAAKSDAEERIALLLATSRDGICEIDLAQRVVRFSPRCLAMLDCEDAAEVLGDRPASDCIPCLLERVHPDDRARVAAAHDAYLCRETHAFVSEHRSRTRSGGYRWLQARGHATWDKAGRVTRYTLCFADPTQGRIVESLLQDTVSRLDAVLRHVGEGVITLDGKRCIRTFNPAAERIFGCSQEDVLDHEFDLLVPLLKTVRELPIDLAFRTIKDRGDCVGLRRDGVTIPIEITATRSIVANSAMYTVLVRDVSERRQVEDELRRARDKAEAGLRAKSEFLAVMSHEVRTPLNGVLGMAQLLHETNLTPVQADTVRTIQRSGEGLLGILNDLLDFSKIEAGRMALERAPFDIAFQIRDVFDLLAPQAAERGLELIVDYGSDVPQRVLGDAARFRQVLLNLCGNAIKFTHAGHVAVTVVALGRSGNNVRLRVSVEDTGIGIDASQHVRLFEPFIQADVSTTRRFGGTGLGLAICRQLVELMDGSIGVSSTRGSGSTFTFELSLGVAPDDRASAPSKTRAGRAVLLVDCARAASVIARDLTMLGYDVCGVDSLAEILTLDFDLLVLDAATLDVQTESLVAGFHERGLSARTVLLVPGFGYVSESPAKILGFACLLGKPVFAHELAAAVEYVGAGIRSGAPEIYVARNPSPIAGNDNAALNSGGSAETSEVAVSDVLVVEDNTINQRVARRMLERLGCRVAVANNGREALEMWRKTAFDLIFMDVHMPELDGYETTRIIRDEEQAGGCGPIPIIAMTANAGANEESKCRVVGMSDFLSKPVKVSQLEEMLVRWTSWNALNTHPRTVDGEATRFATLRNV